MRKIALCVLPALMLLPACQDRPAPVAPDAAASTAQVATNRASTHANPPPAPGRSLQPPRTPPGIVEDTTPVDTRIVEVQTADNADGKRLTGIMTDRFKPADGVFLSIRTLGTANKYTLSAKWLTPTGQTLTEYSQTIATAGQTDTVFSLSKPDGWPKGKYSVALSINGRLLRTVPFTVQ